MSISQEATEHQLTVDLSKHLVKPGLYFVSIFGQFLVVDHDNTVQDRRKITQIFFGEHKAITPERQFLGLILSFFMHLRWPWLSRFFE